MADTETSNGNALEALSQPDEFIQQETQASQTAQEFIAQQLQLEADAREALPYQFDTCTRSLGPIRQNLYSCLTCNPPPVDPTEPYNSGGICYSCSISCHGEHTLVELFTRRNFVCDCGTTRLPSTSSCTLRLNLATGTQGDVRLEESSATNTYNHNFQNRFCGCNEVYDAHQEKGTMFQCMGLATEAEGGCGEDWWHPECLMGLKRDWYGKEKPNHPSMNGHGSALETVKEEVEDFDVSAADVAAPETRIGESASVTSAIGNQEHDAEGSINGSHPLPPGFPAEDDFEHLICYKCTSIHPWIKRYGGTAGFLAALPFRKGATITNLVSTEVLDEKVKGAGISTKEEVDASPLPSLKRKLDEDGEEPVDSKRTKTDNTSTKLEPLTSSSSNICRYDDLPPAPSEPISLFVRSDFRDHFCRCPTHFPFLAPHPYLLEEEEAYEPPTSSAGDENDAEGNNRDNHDRHSASSRSLLDRGEAALSNMDRVRAIEGVMVYNRLRDKVKEFLKPFAESGTAVAAEDIKKYFEKLRGDDEAIKQARVDRGDVDRG